MENQRYKDTYISRINRAIDYIEGNIWSELNLTNISRESSFSPFHFHRIFKGMMGETLNKFIQRVRLEKAASQLIHNPKKSITDIAYDCGFSGPASFARVFKERYGKSASEWQKENHRKNRKIESNNDKRLRNDRKASPLTIRYHQNTKLWRLTMDNNLNATFEVKQLEKMTMAYIRHVGPYKGDEVLFGELFGKIAAWGGARDLLKFPETKFMTVYHDDPKVTEEEKLRISVGFTTDPGTETDGMVNLMEIPSGKYCVASFEIDADQYEAAWNAVYGDWLPESGYQPAEGVCMEICKNDPKQHPENKHQVEICIPVQPL